MAGGSALVMAAAHKKELCVSNRNTHRERERDLHPAKNAQSRTNSHIRQAAGDKATHAAVLHTHGKRAGDQRRCGAGPADH